MPTNRGRVNEMVLISTNIAIGHITYKQMNGLEMPNGGNNVVWKKQVQIAVLTLCVADKFRKYTIFYKNVVFVSIASQINSKYRARYRANIGPEHQI